jgi:hypothetical protein
MSNHSPNSIATSIKVIADAIKTTFGAAVVIVAFVGVSLVSLSFGWGNFTAEQRERIIYVLLGFLGITLIILFLMRICVPHGLGGPPIPKSEGVTFEDSK